MNDKQEFNLSDYTIIGPLGRGAVSFVYKIQNRKNSHYSALKVIEKKNKEFQRLEQKIKNEIDIHSQLNNHNILKLYNHYEDKENDYINLELCENGDLHNYIQQKPDKKLTIEEIKDKGFQILNSINYLHEKKIIHRDLKLANILLANSNKTIKLGDFGLAIKVNNKEECDTLCGTPNYISPEIINRQPYGFKCDCWSFGCILYSLATGKPPFEGKTVQETLQRIKQSDLVFKSSETQSMDPCLKDLITKLICHDQNQRISIQESMNHPFFSLQKNKNDYLNAGKINSLSLNDDTSILKQNNNYTLFQNCNNKVQIINKYTFFHNSEIDQNLNNQINSLSDSKVQKKNMQKSKSKDHFSINSLISNRNRELNQSESDKSSKILRKINSGTLLDNEFLTESTCQQSNLQQSTYQHSKLQQSNYEQSKSYQEANYKSQDQGFLENNVQNDDVVYYRLNTQKLKIQEIKTKNGLIIINDDKSIEFEIQNKNVLFKISHDGSQISILKHQTREVYKQYKLINLPSKYFKFYNYGLKILQRQVNQIGVFQLIQQQEDIQYEVRFHDGYEISHLINTNILYFRNKLDIVYEINLNNPLDYLKNKYSKIVQISIQMLKTLLQHQYFK